MQRQRRIRTEAWSGACTQPTTIKDSGGYDRDRMGYKVNREDTRGWSTGNSGVILLPES